MSENEHKKTNLEIKMASYGKLVVFALNSGQQLGLEICKHLKITSGEIKLIRFSDGEMKPKFEENIRGRDVFIICSTITSDDWIALFLTLDAAMRASARRITAIIPYFGYARQERKAEPRVPISAKVMAKMIEANHADRVLTMDLHAGAIQGFFDIPVDHLYASPTITAYIKESLNLENNVVGVTPDIGASKMVNAVCRLNGWEFAVFDKEGRPGDNQLSDSGTLLGNVNGKTCLIIDDLIDTAGTLKKAASALKNAGATKIYAAITHPVLSGDALTNIRNSEIEKLFVSDSIELPVNKREPKIEVVSVAQVFAKAIMFTHQDKSISSLFPELNKI